jgi:hypothetical protein
MAENKTRLLRLGCTQLCALLTVLCTIALQTGTRATEQPISHCSRLLNLEANKTYTLAALVSNDWNWFASDVVHFAGRVSTDDGTNTFSDVWLLHTDLFRLGVNEDLSDARGPVFDVRERESFWGKGSAEVRVRTRGTKTTVCMCTSNDASKTANEACLTRVKTGGI